MMKRCSFLIGLTFLFSLAVTSVSLADEGDSDDSPNRDVPTAPAPEYWMCLQDTDNTESFFAAILTLAGEQSSVLFLKIGSSDLPELLADMPCQNNTSSAGLTCRDPNVVDTGYVMSVTAVDAKGERALEIAQSSIAGHKVVANLVCTK